jgi:hypothetical protein
MKRMTELDTSVSRHEYENAMPYAAMMRANPWKRYASRSDMLTWMVLAEDVIVLEIAPVDTRSSFDTG